MPFLREQTPEEIEQFKKESELPAVLQDIFRRNKEGRSLNELYTTENNLPLMKSLPLLIAGNMALGNTPIGVKPDFTVPEIPKGKVPDIPSPSASRLLADRLSGGKLDGLTVEEKLVSPEYTPTEATASPRKLAAKGKKLENAILRHADNYETESIMDLLSLAEKIANRNAQLLRANPKLSPLEYPTNLAEIHQQLVTSFVKNNPMALPTSITEDFVSGMSGKTPGGFVAENLLDLANILKSGELNSLNLDKLRYSINALGQYKKLNRLSSTQNTLVDLFINRLEDLLENYKKL